MSMPKKPSELPLPIGTPTDGTVLPNEPTLGEIQARAYEAYVKRRRIDGFDLEDWLQAEKELKESQ